MERLALFIVLFVAHSVGDYWVQTSWQAERKEHSHVACSLHIATYTMTLLLFLVVVSVRFDVDLSISRVIVALSVSAVTHYLADRRRPLRRVALAIGRDRSWIDNGGLALLDQSWHTFWLFVCAIVIA